MAEHRALAYEFRRAAMQIIGALSRCHPRPSSLRIVETRAGPLPTG
jgi:hypothetical protein